MIMSSPITYAGKAETKPRGSRPSPLAPRPSPLGSAGFTLVEMLVTVSLLAFIVLGLYAMFNQVQRAFRMSMTQVDLLEAGRGVTEMLPRELEQLTPCRLGYSPTLPPSGPSGINFYVAIPAASAIPQCYTVPPGYTAPLLQPLPGTTTPPTQRTNLLEDCFFLVRQNQTWVGIGYCVRTTNPQTGGLDLPQATPGQATVGSLYRYVTNMPVIYPSTDPKHGLPEDPSQLYWAFHRASVPGSTGLSNRICDGVIHFRFRAFNTNGFLINAPLRFATTTVTPSPIAPGEIGLYGFGSNAVPASVEMELGILDQHSWERYNSIGNPTAGLAYLQRPEVTSRVQIFRQRIPIRNVDPLAYQ